MLPGNDTVKSRVSQSSLLSATYETLLESLGQ